MFPFLCYCVCWYPNVHCLIHLYKVYVRDHEELYPRIRTTSLHINVIVEPATPVNV